MPTSKMKEVDYVLLKQALIDAHMQNIKTSQDMLNALRKSPIVRSGLGQVVLDKLEKIVQYDNQQRNKNIGLLQRSERVYLILTATFFSCKQLAISADDPLSEQDKTITIN